MGVMGRLRTASGQITVELMVALPVLLAVAVIAVNAMTFLSECSVFDRVACEAVRAYATAPAHGQDAGQAVSLVERAVRAQLDADNLDVSASHGITSVDFDEFTVTLVYHPTLFGMGLRSQMLGVSMPGFKHEVRYVVDSYRPGVFI